jgi:hypothetical protein
MNTDTLAADLKDMAEQWDAPVLDTDAITRASRTRTIRRRRLAIAVVTIALVVGGVATAASLIATGSRNSPSTKGGIDARPAFPPALRVTALDRSNHPITRPYVHVIARARRGVQVTVRAQLSFPTAQRIRVLQAALLVAKPGTQPGVGGGSAPDAYYASTEIVRGDFISATSPEPRILTVTIPNDLPHGTYPVIVVIQSRRLDGPDRSTYTASGGIGAIVITGD